MTKLSVNINKFATLRNSRGGNNPNLLQVAQDAERFGAQGITVHPRPDERHIRYQDVYELKKVITTEFNIEGNPKERSFADLVLANTPAQVTLVPDACAFGSGGAVERAVAFPQRQDYACRTIKMRGSKACDRYFGPVCGWRPRCVAWHCLW